MAKDTEDFGITYTGTEDIEDDTFWNSSVTADPDEVEEITEEDEEEEVEEVEEEEVEKKATPAKKTTPKKEEETEEEEEEVIEDDKEEGEDQIDYTALHKDLISLNIFTQPAEGEDEISKTPEQLAERFQKEAYDRAVSMIYDEIIGKYGEDGVEMFEAIVLNNVAPKEYFKYKTNIESVESLDISQETDQEKVVRKYYEDLKWSEDKIESKIQRLKNNMELEEEAQIAHEKLLETEKEQFKKIEADKKAEIVYKEQVKQQTIANYNKALNEGIKKREISGIPIDQNSAKELFADLTQERYKIPATGEKLTEFDKVMIDLKRPENSELKLKLFMLYKTLQKDPNLEMVKKKGASEVNTKLFNSLTHKDRVINKSKTTQKKTSFEDHL